MLSSMCSVHKARSGNFLQASGRPREGHKCCRPCAVSIKVDLVIFLKPGDVLEKDTNAGSMCSVHKGSNWKLA